MKRLMLFINGRLGIDVLNHVISDPETQISAIVINEKQKRVRDYRFQILNLLSKTSVKDVIFEYSNDLWKQHKFLDALSKSNLGFSALFGHLIPEPIIIHFGGNLYNLHPSLLPFGRGADPIAWSIIDDNPIGVSLHQIDKGIDTGRVISQIEIPFSIANTSGDLYEEAMRQLFKIFVKFYSQPHFPILTQISDQAGTYHHSSELDQIRVALLQGDPNIERTLRIIQALSFSDGRSARIKLQNGEIWTVKLSATREINEESYE